MLRFTNLNRKKTDIGTGSSYNSGHEAGKSGRAKGIALSHFLSMKKSKYC